MEEPLTHSHIELYYQQFLGGCLVVCFCMVILWLCRIKNNKKSAWIMSFAFMIMGLLIYTLKMDLNPLWTKGLTIVLGFLLLADVWVRSDNYKRN